MNQSIAFAKLGDNARLETIAAKVEAMKMVARSKAAEAQGSKQFLRAVEMKLDQIAHAQVAHMAPVNENLLGLALILLAELKRKS